MTKFQKEKVGEDVGMADEFDDELLITRLRRKFSLYYIGVFLI